MSASEQLYPSFILSFVYKFSVPDEGSGPATPSNLRKMSLSSKKKKQADRVINEAAHLLEAGQPLNYETGQLEVRLGQKTDF